MDPSGPGDHHLLGLQIKCMGGYADPLSPGALNKYVGGLLDLPRGPQSPWGQKGGGVCTAPLLEPYCGPGACQCSGVPTPETLVYPPTLQEH